MNNLSPKNQFGFSGILLFFFGIVIFISGFFIFQNWQKQGFSDKSSSQVKQLKKIGILQHIKTLDAVYDGFKAGLTELGYKEGVDVIYDLQTTGGIPEKAGEVAKKLINNNPDLILAITTSVLGPALKESTASGKNIPIVFTNGNGVVEAGLAKSYKSSGTIITGIVSDDINVTVKKLEFLKRIKPDAEKVGVFASHKAPSGHAAFLAVKENAPKLGLKIVEYEFKNLPGPESLAEIQKIADSVKPGDIDAILTLPEPVVNSQSKAHEILNNLGLRIKAPTLFLNITNGGLLSYNLDLFDSGKQAAVMADKVLKGTPPSEIPLEFSRKNYLVVNLKIAKQIGITIPDSILAIADKKIE